MHNMIHIIFIVLGYLLFFTAFVACLANAVAPKWMWMTFDSWKARKEPTKTYFVVKRIAGILGMIIIAAAALVPTIMYYIS